MRKLILLTIVIFSLVAAIGVGFSQKQTPQQKSYPVSMTPDKWNIVILAIISPDDVTANQKKQSAEDIVNQVKVQMAADTVKPKSK